MPKSAPSHRDDHIYRSFVNGMEKFLVLDRAGRGPIYGRALMHLFRDLGSPISPGKLYPLLRGLEKEGLLRSHTAIVSGRMRKYYETTPAGNTRLRRLRRAVLTVFNKAVCRGAR